MQYRLIAFLFSRFYLYYLYYFYYFYYHFYYLYYLHFSNLIELIELFPLSQSLVKIAVICKSDFSDFFGLIPHDIHAPI